MPCGCVGNPSRRCRASRRPVRRLRFNRHDGSRTGASGGAIVRTHPNASLQADVKSGAAIQNYNIGDALDGYGYGYYSIDFAYGHEIPYSKNPTDPRLSAGLRLRAMRSYFSHQFVNGTQIINGETTVTYLRQWSTSVSAQSWPRASTPR